VRACEDPVEKESRYRSQSLWTSAQCLMILTELFKIFCLVLAQGFGDLGELEPVGPHQVEPDCARLGPGEGVHAPDQVPVARLKRCTTVHLRLGGPLHLPTVSNGFGN